MVIWYGGPGHESAGKLAAWMGMQGIHAKLACKKKYLATLPSLDKEVMVAWGRRLPGEFSKPLNAAAPIGDKLKELAMLMVAGVPVPGVTNNHHPGWLARKNQHHDGDDLVVSDKGDFYVEPIQTSYEFRVNVFGGKVFRTGLKVPKPGTTQKTVSTGVGDIPIRTGSGGWTWIYSQAPLDATHTERAPLREYAVRAVKALGYDFGAVDVGYRGNGKWVVFEVNSAPALEGDDLERYGQLILEYAQSKGEGS